MEEINTWGMRGSSWALATMGQVIQAWSRVMDCCLANACWHSRMDIQVTGVSTTSIRLGSGHSGAGNSSQSGTPRRLCTGQPLWVGHPHALKAISWFPIFTSPYDSRVSSADRAAFLEPDCILFQSHSRLVPAGLQASSLTWPAGGFGGM